MLPVPYSASCPRQHCETLVRIMVIRANRKVDLRCRHTGAQPRNGAICASAYCRHAKSSKALPDEAATVDRLGMTYIHIPVEFQNPTEQDFLQFCAVMEQLQDVPVHVHCIANARVSAFFYRFRRDVLGMDEARARAEMEAVWRPKGIWVEFVKGRGEKS